MRARHLAERSELRGEALSALLMEGALSPNEPSEAS
jgi:hypothetical protein